MLWKLTGLEIRSILNGVTVRFCDAPPLCLSSVTVALRIPNPQAGVRLPGGTPVIGCDQQITQLDF